jgi:hypothetical protein
MGASRAGGKPVIYTSERAIRQALCRRGLDGLWWGAALLDEWAYAVGTRYAERSRPILEKSPLLEKGLLTIAVPNSIWAQELSTLGIAARLNGLLGRRLIRQVRFEIRGGGT